MKEGGTMEIDEAICPSCGSKATVIQTQVNVPFFHDLFLITVKCEKCGLKVSDVMNMRFGRPIRCTFHVQSLEDLNAKVVRSSTSTIRIPELGASMEPGPAAQPFITNVEGVLHRFLDIAQTLKNWSTTPQETQRCEQAINAINKAISGQLKFTIILEDPLGNGMILLRDQKRVKVEELTKEEVKELKTGPYMILEARSIEPDEE